MFYLDTFLQLVGFGVVFIIGIIIGVVVGYLSYEHAFKKETKEGTERRIGDQRRWKHVNKQTATIEEEQRQIVHYGIADIRAPSLDSAGVVMEDEEIRFSVDIIDISRRGLAVLSQNFLKVGLTIQIALRIEKKEVPPHAAQVRNVTLMPNGLRIGLEFLEVLEKI